MIHEKFSPRRALNCESHAKRRNVKLNAGAAWAPISQEKHNPCKPMPPGA